MKHLKLSIIVLVFCSNLTSQTYMYLQLNASGGLNSLSPNTFNQFQQRWPSIKNPVGGAFEFEGRLIFNIKNSWEIGVGYSHQQQVAHLSYMQQRPDSYFWTERTDDISIYKRSPSLNLSLGYQLFKWNAWSVPIEIGYSYGSLRQVGILHKLRLNYREVEDDLNFSEYTENNEPLFQEIHSPYLQIGIQYQWERFYIKSFFRLRSQYTDEVEYTAISENDTLDKSLMHFFEVNTFQQQFLLGCTVGVRLFKLKYPVIQL